MGFLVKLHDEEKIVLEVYEDNFAVAVVVDEYMINALIEINNSLKKIKDNE